MVLTAPFRAATRDDCLRIAELYRHCSGGVADYIWHGERARYPGLAPLEIGAALLRPEGAIPGYRHAVVADRDGSVDAVLLGYRMPPAAGPPPGASDAVLAPLSKLRAPGTWFIRVLSVDPRRQDRGLGTQLLRLARRLAIEQGCGMLSAVVFEQNEPCLRALRRAGFEISAREPLVEHPMLHYGGNALLVCAPAGF